MQNKFFIERKQGDIMVAIMFNRADKKYHFVNLTKEHICECGFDNVEEALADLDNYKNDGRIINYHKVR